MRKGLKFAAILFAVAMTLPASATCEYCKGPGGNRYCSDVTGSHPSGNDQCHAWYGQCTYRGFVMFQRVGRLSRRRSMPARRLRRRLNPMRSSSQTDRR